MPLRLLAILLPVAAGALYLAWFNDAPVELVLAPGATFTATAPVLVVLGFAAGVAAVFLIYSWDTVRSAFASWGDATRRRRIERAGRLRLAAREQLVMERPDAARTLYRRALRHHPGDLTLLMELGTLERETGNLTDAIDLHARAVAADDRLVEPRFELAADYVAARQYPNAVALLTETRKLTARALPPLRRIRDIFVEVENWEEALATQRLIVDVAARAETPAERAMLAPLQYERGVELLAAGDRAGAEELFKGALRADAGFIPATLRLAEMQERSGWGNDAVKTLEKGFRQTGSPVILTMLELLLSGRGETDRSVGELRWARDLHPERPELRMFLAEALLAAGKPEEARKELSFLPGEAARHPRYHLVAGNVHRAEHNVTAALDALSAALTAAANARFLFSCGACGQLRRDYAARCDRCGAWNRLDPVAR